MHSKYHIEPRLIIFSLLSISIFTTGCKKLVDVYAPTTSLSGQNVYSNDLTASAVLTGLYTLTSNAFITGGEITSIGFITGLCSDELTLYGGQPDATLLAYYQNNQSSRNMANFQWNNIYQSLYTVNSAIEGLSTSKTMTESTRLYLLGEAKFMRSLYYFYLVNLYGDIPLVTESDYSINKSLSRAPASKVWQQIINDLTDAKALLSEKYLTSSLLKVTTERVRPTKWAAIALLARVYLYTKDWKNAEAESTTLINQTSLYQLSSLEDVFKKNNSEAIWQLQPVAQGNWNTQDARAYIFTSEYGPNGAGGVYLSDQLLNAFEPGDQRKQNWIDTVTFDGTLYSFAYKYKSNTSGDPVTEYHTILRLGEQYLIRSEARAQQNNIAGSQDDLNAIRQRAGLDKTKASSQPALLEAILHERQVELFTEWGHRWLDLKRTNTVNAVMSKVTPLKGGTWSSNWQLFPIPFIDIQTDTNIEQNPGY